MKKAGEVNESNNSKMPLYVSNSKPKCNLALSNIGLIILSDLSITIVHSIFLCFIPL